MNVKSKLCNCSKMRKIGFLFLLINALSSVIPRILIAIFGFFCCHLAICVDIKALFILMWWFLWDRHLLRKLNLVSVFLNLWRHLIEMVLNWHLRLERWILLLNLLLTCIARLYWILLTLHLRDLLLHWKLRSLIQGLVFLHQVISVFHYVIVLGLWNWSEGIFHEFFSLMFSFMFVMGHVSVLLLQHGCIGYLSIRRLFWQIEGI